MKGSIIVLLFFAAGCLLGVMGWLPFNPEGSNLTLYMLYALMLQVGLSIGFQQGPEVHRGKPASEIPADSAGNRMWHTSLLRTGQPAALTLEHLRLHGGRKLICLLFTLVHPDYTVQGTLHRTATGNGTGTIALLANIFREMMALLALPYFANISGNWHLFQQRE